MTVRTGIDLAVAPSPTHLKAMVDAIGATWCVAYVGGPRSGGSGWSPDYVRGATAAGVQYWLAVYVGRQVVPSLGLDDYSLLTAAQGAADGADAVALLRTWPWGLPCPIALDVEFDTAQRATEAATAYSDGWCKAVRDAGYTPGVYAPLAFLERIWTETNRPSFAFAADWIRSAVDHGLDPEAIPGLPAGVAQGARVWQYATSSILGTAADIDVADIPLAFIPGPTAADYAAAAWVAYVDALSSSVPVAQCIAHKAAIRAFVATHP